MFTKSGVFRMSVLGVSFMVAAAGAVVSGVFVSGTIGMAQTPAPAPAGRQIGTVKAIAGSGFTLATDAGQQVVVSVADGARILQLTPGSTNLKDAQAITLAGIVAGDRVLVTGKSGEGAAGFTASRVILMKSSDIAQKHAMEQEDWQKHGSGGIVSAIDASTGALTVMAGAKKIQVSTSSSTAFRRYAGDSVKFEDAKPGTLSQIQVGDQLRVRGAKSEDGLSVQAEEVVSGSFKNLAGLIASIDTASGTLTLKDLATKRMMTVKITTNSNIHALPPQAARMFAARAGAAAGGETHASAQSGASPIRGAGEHGAMAGGSAGGPGRSAGADLSQVVSRLPAGSVADLKVGDAVMIVASQENPGSAQVTAVTLLSGVEPLLAAASKGSPDMALSPWSVGSDAPEGAQ
ncbi:MAG: DUF5666 domain-containing protein [Edaphobacter sp.]